MNGAGRVVVVGSCMMDLVVEAPRRPLAGETVVGTGFGTYLGGKGFNQAVAAARSGAPTALVARVGDDEFGRRFRAQLEVDGIDATAVVTDEHEGTGVATPLVEGSGENSIVIVPRANDRVGVDDLVAAAAVVGDAAVVLLQLELPIEPVLEAAARAKAAGATVVLNPAPAVADLSAFEGLVDVLVPNQVEATGLVPAASTPVDAGRVLRDELGATVIVTVGAAGVWIVGETDPELVPAHEVDVVDTVGAGDAFCGALGARLAAGDELRAAVSYANAAAALAVVVRGAEPSMPSADAVRGLLTELTTG